ncbi:MAG: hypothetical protein AAGI90_07145 [Chlamydiota bacterium]
MKKQYISWVKYEQETRSHQVLVMLSEYVLMLVIKWGYGRKHYVHDKNLSLLRLIVSWIRLRWIGLYRKALSSFLSGASTKEAYVFIMPSSKVWSVR